MKTLLLAGAALGALVCAAHAADYKPVAAPVMAQQWSGDLALYAGFVLNRFEDEKSSDYSEDGLLIGGLARANIWLAPGMSAQIDLFGEHASFDGYGPTVLDIAGHLSMRGPRYLLGVFGSVGSAANNTAGTIGVEAQNYFGPILLYGQGGYSTMLGNGNDVSAWYIHGEGRYFLNPNLLLSANLGLAKISYTGCCPTGLDATAIRWGANVESRFSRALGAFATYRGSHASGEDGGYDWSSTSHAFLLGIKVYHNTASLQSQAQGAETLYNFNPLTGVNNLSAIGFGAGSNGNVP